MRALEHRGLVYLEVDVRLDDRFSILPLEGFVSNKTSEQGDSAVDPTERLLYAVFVASSEHLKAGYLGNHMYCGYSVGEGGRAVAPLCVLLWC